MAVTVSEKELKLIRDTLSSRFNLQKIILFGSQASETADYKSDVDLLIIAHFGGKRRDLMFKMNRVLDILDHPVDILILTPEEFDAEKEIPGTIAKYAGTFGRTVYDCAS